jgi:hypothetical protein
MVSLVSTKNMVSIPQAIARLYGIQPGWKLDWEQGRGADELLVRVIPDRAELARRLKGQGRRYSPAVDALADMVAERAQDA